MADERTFEELLGNSDGLGKLVTRRALSPTIPRREWVAALPQRFARAGHPIDDDALDAIMEFGGEEPYPTMSAARGAALTAGRLGGATDLFCAKDGIEQAKERLRDDGF